MDAPARRWTQSFRGAAIVERSEEFWSGCCVRRTGGEGPAIAKRQSHRKTKFRGNSHWRLTDFRFETISFAALVIEIRASITWAPLRSSLHTTRLRRRDGRVAEGGSLLNCYTGKTVSGVRIPLSPPSLLYTFKQRL